jgi:O-antigen/teichoic acid export membrane protein
MHGFQDPCHGARERDHKARLLHMSCANLPMRHREPERFTVDEKSFRNAKPARSFLVAYKAFADLAGKGAMFVVTVVAARRLPGEAFGIFALGSTLGWMLAVASDFGIQLHLAREVARRPDEAPALMRSWLRVRIWTTVAAIGLAAVGLLATDTAIRFALPIAVLTLVYACSGLVEFLHYFYRGLSRSDVESSLTLWQRGGTLVCGLAALAWWPDVTVLAVAMLLPVAATLVVSLRIAARFTTSGTPVSLALSAYVTPVVLRLDVLPIGAGIVLSALYFRIDVFLVQRWAGTEPVALYNAVFRLVEALRLFPAAVLAVMLPELCRASDSRPLIRLALPLTAAAVAASAILWAGADSLIALVYGAPFAAAAPAFRILLLAFPLLALNLALTHQLIGWNGQRAYAAICALALVVNVALNAQLIPAWSIDGAAWATLGTEVFLTIGCVIALGIAHGKARGMVREAVAAS